MPRKSNQYLTEEILESGSRKENKIAMGGVDQRVQFGFWSSFDVKGFTFVELQDFTRLNTETACILESTETRSGIGQTQSCNLETMQTKNQEGWCWCGD